MKLKQGLLVMGLCMVVAVVSIVSTVALFTSEDSVTNKFATGTTTDPSNPDAGIEVEENFPCDTNNDGMCDSVILPGMNMTKEVKVNSTANYDQFLRAKIEKQWLITNEDKTESVVTHYKVTTVDGKEKVEYKDFTNKTAEEGFVALDLNRIQLNFAPFGEVKGDSWTTAAVDGYHYYNQLLGKAPFKTAPLLESVTFLSNGGKIITDHDNYYKNLRFDVKVTAEAVQATAGAAWGNTPGYVTGLIKK